MVLPKTLIRWKKREIKVLRSEKSVKCVRDLDRSEEI